MKLTPEHELTAEPQHPTESEWNELAATLTAMGELLTEQMLLLEEIAARPSPWTTREQTAEPHSGEGWKCFELCPARGERRSLSTTV